MSGPDLKYRIAITNALSEEMERDDGVVLMGQDIGKPGGSFGTTRGLQERFGADRVLDMPISEQAIVGAAVGAAVAGLRPVIEILFFDFLGIASDQFVNQAAKIRWFSRGRSGVPMVLMSGVGTGFGMGAQHSQSLESWYAQIPGLKVCWPSTAADAKGLLKTAIRDDDPVLFLETMSDLERVRGPVGGSEDLVPFGKANIAREGSDCTIVTYGAARYAVDKAAAELAEESIEAEVVDLRTVIPWDRETVCASIAKTNRCVVVTDAPVPYGPGGELASTIGELSFDDLDAPVVRVGSLPVPAPQFAQYDRMRQPKAERIATAVRNCQ
jgi:pyruvate/2-oxoglutarate/acetoin dehydrogenase E1 component